MDKKQVVEISKKFAASLVTELDVQKVVLHGSWAHGRPHDDSDIDVAVIIRGFQSGYLELLTKLYRLASEVDLRIEPHLFIEDKDESGFLLHILSHGETIYENIST